jgi:cytochrome o ubiquinol oxidase subunit 2
MRSSDSLRSRPVAAAARFLAVLALTAILSGCGTVVLNPAGDVAQRQGNLVVISTVLMLLIIVPVMGLTALFAWRYRASSETATYRPDWDHSTQLELVIWAAPLLIIICLGAITWVSTHLLDPYRAIGRIDRNTPVTAGAKPLEVDVVALDWKWLFIYPGQGLAAVNELVVPIGRPIEFKITSANVMNSFYVPAMAGQIYAMPGMQTRLNAVMNESGDFAGFSANYSGAGFSQMRFTTHAVSDADFAKWASGVKAGGAGNSGALDRPTYLQLARPSEAVPVMHYASVAPDLYGAILNMCVEPGKMCTSEMMAIDARGGLGKAGIGNVAMLTYDKKNNGGATGQAGAAAEAQRQLAWVRALCHQQPGVAPDATAAGPVDQRPLAGAGLAAPRQTALSGTALTGNAGASAHSILLSRN